MRSKTIFAMGLLNVLLLASLCFRLTPIAHGQIRPAMGKASEYLMIPGEVQGLPGGAVYILDTRNQLLSLRTFDGTRFQDMPPIDLNRIFSKK
ncbi:MAG TPA: hypothetical protein VG326_19675 [Tepidisphaeraceae bacterium]|jgi:hypothetical protein|nr:hypothetical protein [Tepidisphaeraceae bacterium]